MPKWCFMAIWALAMPVLANAQVPLDMRIDEADLIVAGKVTKVQEDAFFTIGPHKFDHAVYFNVAVVEVSALLKAEPNIGKPKEVLIGQPGKRNLNRNPAEMLFKPGQQGIWLLRKERGGNVYWPKDGRWLREPDRNVYWAKQSGQLLDEKETKNVTDLVATRSSVAGGKPAQGLVARAELLESEAHVLVRFSLKNVTAKPVRICDYLGNQPLQAEWIGPDGKMLRSKHYDWLRAADLRGLTGRDFVTIAPGGVHFISPGRNHGIMFQFANSKASNFDNLAQAGKHRVTIGYTNQEDGKAFGLDSVWTGTVTANEVTFTVK